MVHCILVALGMERKGKRCKGSRRVRGTEKEGNRERERERARERERERDARANRRGTRTTETEKSRGGEKQREKGQLGHVQAIARKQRRKS